MEPKLEALRSYKSLTEVLQEIDPLYESVLYFETRSDVLMERDPLSAVKDEPQQRDDQFKITQTNGALLRLKTEPRQSKIDPEDAGFVSNGTRPDVLLEVDPLSAVKDEPQQRDDQFEITQTNCALLRLKQEPRHQSTSDPEDAGFVSNGTRPDVLLEVDPLAAVKDEPQQRDDQLEITQTNEALLRLKQEPRHQSTSDPEDAGLVFNIKQEPSPECDAEHDVNVEVATDAYCVPPKQLRTTERDPVDVNTGTVSDGAVCDQRSQSVGRTAVNMNPYVLIHRLVDTELSSTENKVQTSSTHNKQRLAHFKKKRQNKTNSCYDCSKTFTRRSQLIVHSRSHNGEKPYSCDVCNKCFLSKSHQVKHRLIHSKKKSFTCDVCSKYFSRKQNLVEHFRIHSKEKPYTCNLCSKYFSRKQHVVEHRRIHSGEKPYSCDLCGRCFSQRSSLSTHYRIHGIEKSFTCDLCSKSFSRKDSLVTHLRIHRGEKPYSCDVCNKCFSRKDVLVVHFRIHSKEKPYTCNLCSKSFSSKSYLVKHLIIHSNKKSFTCDLCSKSFSSKSHLVRHRIIHSNKKIFTCDLCSKCFSRKDYLVGHLRIHSGEKP